MIPFFHKTFKIRKGLFMNYRDFGKTGEKISALGFGCMRFPEYKIGEKSFVDQDKVDEMLGYAYENGVRIFVTGGAIGFDTLAARQVILFKMSHPDVRLHLIAPCINQADNWTAQQRSAYEFVLQNSDHVEYVCDEYKKGCMQIRNRRLAEECDMLVWVRRK